jgi:hypothetical protein
VSLPARTARLNVGFLSVGTTGMPLEMSGEVRADISSRNTASANGRKNEPPSGAPTTRPGWLQAIPLFQAIGCSKDLDDRDGFSARYASAKRQLIEAWSDQLVRIADNELLEPNDRRVRIDTRKWLMSKLHPGKYGDKVTVAGDAENPLQHVVRALDLTKLSGLELDALERFTDARLAATELAEDSKGSNEQS